MRAVDTTGVEPLAHPVAVMQDIQLRLRADVGEVDEALADWWQTFSLADELGREDLLAQLRATTTRPQRVARSQRATPPAGDAPIEATGGEDPDGPKKRRRRRRRRGDADAPPSAAD